MSLASPTYCSLRSTVRPQSLMNTRSSLRVQALTYALLVM
jgi:hypothetical protein